MNKEDYKVTNIPKILQPIHSPGMALDQTEKEFPVHSKNVGHKYLMMGVGAWTFFCLLFFVFLKGEASGARFLLGGFVAAGLLILCGLYASHKKIMHVARETKSFSVRMDGHGIRFPSVIFEHPMFHNKSEHYFPWSAIEDWTVDSDSDGPDYYTLKTTDGQIMKILRSFIKDEISFLDAVRETGQKTIILKTSIS